MSDTRLELLRAVAQLEGEYGTQDDMPSAVYETWVILNELLEKYKI